MTTGRINQVAIGVVEAVTWRPRRPCDRRAQPISQLARVIVHHQRQLSDIAAAAAADGPGHRLGPTDGRTDGALYRTPSDHSFRGRNTQDRQGTDTELLLDRHVARDRHRPKAVPLQRLRRTSRSDVSRPGTDIIAKHGGSRPSGRRFKAVTTLAQPDLPICFAFASTGRHQLSFALTLTPYNIWSDCDTVP